MKSPFLPLLLIPGLILGSCASASKNNLIDQQPISMERENRQGGEVQDYQGREGGGAIPDWVEVYHSQGLRGVEKLPGYQGSYVFIADNEGSHRDALEQWKEAFNLDMDLPPLLSLRLQELLISESRGKPDLVYGRLYAQAIRVVNDAEISGSREAGSFWTRESYRDEEGAEREIYHYYILIVIDRDTLQKQLYTILGRTRNLLSPSREEADQLRRLREAAENL